MSALNTFVHLLSEKLRRVSCALWSHFSRPRLPNAGSPAGRLGVSLHSQRRSHHLAALPQTASARQQARVPQAPRFAYGEGESFSKLESQHHPICKHLLILKAKNLKHKYFKYFKNKGIFKIDDPAPSNLGNQFILKGKHQK